jgi:NADH dehydrogenase FAD-containing subunit
MRQGGLCQGGGCAHGWPGAHAAPARAAQVNKRLQVVGETNIFAGGDVADLPVEKLALASMQHGVTIARNICRLEKGRSPLACGQKGLIPLQSPPRAQLISLATECAPRARRKARLTDCRAPSQPWSFCGAPSC